MHFRIQKTFAIQFRARTAMLAITFLTWANMGLAQVDLEVEADLSIPSIGFVDNTFYWLFKMRQSGASGSATFPTGSVVLRVDLPEGLVFDDVRTSSGTYFSGDVECAQQEQTIECISVGNYTMTRPGSTRNIIAFLTLNDPSEFSIPAAGGVCRIDPDDVVDEGEGDGPLSNDCFGKLGPVVIKELPPDPQQNWLTVTNLDNIIHEYDHAALTVTKAMTAEPESGPAAHLVSEIVEHPQSGDLYVLYHVYQNDQHSLGILDPAGEIMQLGDTGTEFHDAAFAPNGSIYGIGADGILYSIDPGTGVSAGLCTASTQGYRAGLAWHADVGLVHIAHDRLDQIDTSGLTPGSPQDTCPLDSVPLGLLFNVTAAEVSGEYIYVSNGNGQLILISLDGAAANLGRMATNAGGFVPDRTLPDVPSISCPAPFYTIASRDSQVPSLLFAVNPDNGSLTYVRQTEDYRISTLDWDKTTRRLWATAREIQTGDEALLSIDPCTSSVATAPLEIWPYYGMDITPQGDAWLIGGEFAELDLSATTITPIEKAGAPGYSSSLAIRGDQVFIDSDEWPQTNALQIHSLVNWPLNPVSMPLQYAAGVEFGSSQVIYDLDVSPGDGQLYAIVQRADDSWDIPDPLARSNVLAKISNGGLVTSLMELPVSAQALAGTHNRMHANGFEATADGCYSFVVEDQYFAWTWGENQVSTSGSSEVNDRPVFVFSDPECTVPLSDASPIAHAYSQEEADALCLEENFPFAQLMDFVAPVPSTGQFYNCND